MKITRIETLCHRLANPRSRLSLNESTRPETADLVAVRLTTENGLIGTGFSSVSAGSAAIKMALDNDLAPLLVDQDFENTEKLWAKAQARFRTTGFSGIAARAYSLVDIALWDLKAKEAQLPLAQLLGGARSSTPCFLGDVALNGTESSHTIKAARPLLAEGVLGVAIEVGAGEIQIDADRVQQIRDGLGDSAWLGITANGSYDLGTALAMAHFYEEDVGIDWFDSPLPVEDRTGYRRLAERMEVSLAIGSAFDRLDDFRQILEVGDIRVLRPQVARLGGITPFLKLAAVAEVFQARLVPYRLPEIGVHLACGLPNIPMAETGTWLPGVFTEALMPTDGKLVPPDRPGHGFEFTPEILGKFAAV